MSDAVLETAVEEARASKKLRRLTCVAVRDETPTVKTFVLTPSDNMPDAALAGQSLTFRLEIGGDVLWRTFSIASAPGLPIEVTVKRHSGGRATVWMHETLSPGHHLEAGTPRGRFTLTGDPGRPLAFISAGSGATPVMAMLRDLDRRGATLDLAWHHAARTSDEILFATELAAFQARHQGLQVTVALSAPEPGWFGLSGRASRRQMAAAIPDLGRRDVFCCGPAGFMEAIKLIHAAEGAPRERFHSESFHALSPAASPSEAEAVGRVRPSFPLEIGGRTITVEAEETILRASLRQGVVIPCGCAQGICGTCIVKARKGRFRMNHQGGLSPDEEAAGYLLACSTTLDGPAAIDL